MPNLTLPKAAISAVLPRDIHPQIASSYTEPPAGKDWLHERHHLRR